MVAVRSGTRRLVRQAAATIPIVAIPSVRVRTPGGTGIFWRVPVKSLIFLKAVK
jgi:hypothetical protein